METQIPPFLSMEYNGIFNNIIGTVSNNGKLI